MIIQEPVQAAIWHTLNHYDFKDATFLAERLCAEVENDETIFLLATCYYRSNMIHQAYWLLQTKLPRSPQCRYLLAKCAYQLKKIAEAESALSVNTNFAEIKNFDDFSKEFGEVACFALLLVAKICSQTERYSIAIEAYKRALKLNPFLWNAFAELCNLGEKVDPNAIFQFPNTDIFNTCQGNINLNSIVLCGPTGGTGNFIGDINIGQGTTATTIGSDLINNLNNSCCNYILSSSVDQLTTPNNTVNIIKGNGNGMIQTTPSTIEDTPIYNNNLPDNQNCNNYDTPFKPQQKQFKYLSVISPGTPSFGVLPISPCNVSNVSSGGGGGIGGGGGGGGGGVVVSGGGFGGINVGGGGGVIGSDNTIGNLISAGNTTSPQTLVEVNQEQKTIGKKLKGHVGSIINRKEVPLQQSKSSSVFYQQQTGNITPRTPNSFTGQNVRRSSRLFSNSNYSVKENNKSPNINKFAQPRSPPRKTKQRMSKISLNNDINEKDKKETEKVETITSNDSKVLLNNSLNNAQTMVHHVLTLKKQSAEGLMALLRELGQSYQQLAQFNCKEALNSFNALPKQHFRTSWVQSMIAVAHYEQREYESAATIFREIHENDPNRLHLMEIYSTSLWHLQREVTLSALAQDLMAQDKNSPITWCVAGNCFSLHKEHETAIKFFKRAIQVDPDFVYSYTLLGHELVITEELDKAMSCFRTAIVKDPRHYNAWFGIGTIYSKQERYELAELHYRRALKINPKNSVIMVHIGAMQFFIQRSDQALQTLNAAIAIDPKNPLCKFHRGSMYYSIGKHQEALRELEELKQIVPKESVVFYLIGKIHKNLGNVDLALMHFSWATDLDPKGANNQLKDAFDSINHAPTNDFKFEADAEVVSERSDDSTQAQLEQDLNYDTDSY